MGFFFGSRLYPERLGWVVPEYYLGLERDMLGCALYHKSFVFVLPTESRASEASGTRERGVEQFLILLHNVLRRMLDC